MELYKYENFDTKTKLFLNKAMDIYSTIKNVSITKKFKYIGMPEYYTLSNFDKKILSLYIAGFLVNGNLKNILSDYNDLKVKEFLSFINLNEESIKKLKNNNYANFYFKNFESDLKSMGQKKSNTHIIKKITPEVIFCFFNSSIVLESNILNYLIKACNIPEQKLHNSFRAIEVYTFLSEIVEEKPLELNDKMSDLKKFQNNVTSYKNKLEFYDETIWYNLDDIQRKFIGQEQVTEFLFYNIVNNQRLALRNDIDDGEKSIIFLDGATGTGKTAITREITDKLDIPFTSTSIVNYSATGYVGGDITDTLKILYQKANENLEKAERGIIVFDEFDKIAYSNDQGLKHGLEMKKAVQQQLLDFMGGGKYYIKVSKDNQKIREIEFDTSKLTFICLAALSDLRARKTTKKNPIGFTTPSTLTTTDDYSITPQDLMEIGLEKELVGRFNTYLHTEEYSKDDLLRILKESTISPIISFDRWISSNDKILQIEDGVYEEIANAAYNLDTGARSLQTIMNNIRTPFIKEVLRGKEKIIYLTQDIVINVTQNITNRKIRK